MENVIVNKCSSNLKLQKLVKNPNSNTWKLHFNLRRVLTTVHMFDGIVVIRRNPLREPVDLERRIA